VSLVDLPHSKQHALDREVINPQNGHILCDPYPAISGFSLRIRWSSRSVKSTISKPKEIVIAFINALLLGDFRIERGMQIPMSNGLALAIVFAVFRSAWSFGSQPAPLI
jgi:hypothetical protein